MPTNLEQTLTPLFAQLFAQPIVTAALLTGPRARLPESVLKVEITRMMLRGEPRYQFAYHQARKVTHRNLTGQDAQTELLALLASQFKQAVFHTAQGDVTVMLNKRFEAIVKDARRKEKGKRRKGDAAESCDGQRRTRIGKQAERAARHFFLFPFSFLLPFPRPPQKPHVAGRGSPSRFSWGWA